MKKKKVFPESRNKKISETMKKRYAEGTAPYGFKKGHHISRKTPISKEESKRISEKLRQGYKSGIRKPINYYLGKKRSEETKLKISIAHMGKTFSEETKKKMSIARKGKTYEEFYGKEKADIVKRKQGITRKGDKNGMWKGGIACEPYDENFNDKFKRAIRKRDNQVCMLCGIHREKIKRAFDVHHINYNKRLTMPQNCISLCNICHIKTNHNRRKWTIFFQSLLSERYNYEYNLNEILITT